VVQSVRGERDAAVAAASILARAEFVRRLEGIGRELWMELPRGASAVEDVARLLVSRHGKDALSRVAKLHFRTTNKVLE
jgi:ribonuclease HIII